jgi:SPP1 gp7 family putative phage head morphogenesis protein
MKTSKKKNLKNRDYWNERAIIRDKKYLKDVKEVEKLLKKEYVKAQKEIKKEIDAYYLSAKDSDLSAYEKYHLESTITAINKELDRLFQQEEELLTQAFIKKYSSSVKETCAELNVSFSEMPESFIREVISQKWSGLSFSERIWDKHRTKLATNIKEELTNGIIRGDSIRDISERIKKKFMVTQNEASRLVRTEMTYVMNQATVNTYKEHGVKHYQFLAFIDSRTSQICKDRDGEIIPVSEAKAGSNLPPLHPNCRSTIIPITTYGD